MTALYDVLLGVDVAAGDAVAVADDAVVAGFVVVVAVSAVEAGPDCERLGIWICVVMQHFVH